MSGPTITSELIEPYRERSGWRIPHDQLITKAGSRVSDLEWDFSRDHSDLGIYSWNFSVTAGGIEVGRLGDPPYRALLSILQQSVAVRWRYYTREDGKRWEARRAAHAVSAARDLAVWLTEGGLREPQEITNDLVEAWVRATALRKDGKERKPQSRRQLVEAILLPWRVKDRIHGTIAFEPEHDQPIGYVPDRGDHEHIPLLPKPVLDHVIGSAIRYIKVYSHDILKAREYLDELTAQWERETGRVRPPYKKGCSRYNAFDSWLSRRFGYRNPKARASMGSVAPWNPDGTFVKDPDTGEPWLDHIRTRHHLQQLENSLRTAAYLVIAFMTAARNTEVNQFKTNCAKVIPQAGGRPDECYITGIVTKHRGAAPEEVSWGVPKVAIKAAGIILAMMDRWRRKGLSDRLFVTQTGGKMSDGYFNVDIKEFVKRIDTPYVNGRPASVTTHMLRVAMAQWLGAEPYGEIAGAFHLQQLGTAAFRGYLREDPRFQSLFEGFVLQGSADHLAMLLDEPKLGGRMGEKILASRTEERQAKLEQTVRALNLAQVGREAPSERVIAKLRKSDRPVYLTNFSTCVFSGDSAECLKDLPMAERTRPVPSRCEPLSCVNSAISRLQVPFYLEDFESYVAMRDAVDSSPSQVGLARAELKSLAEVIMPHISTLQAEAALLVTDLVGLDSREAMTVSMQKRLAVVQDLLRRITFAKVETVFKDD